jgi:benzoyl-CoA-dihydrodiol lyase
LATTSTRGASARGIALPPVERKIDDRGYHYRFVDVQFDQELRTATLSVQGPREVQPDTADQIHVLADRWWPLQMARELDDAILLLRANEPERGLLLLRTSGDPKAVLHCGATLEQLSGDWLVRETVGLLRRTFARLDVSSRSMFAVIDPGSCFAGLLLELALAADRSYMLSTEETEGPPQVALDATNFKLFPAINGATRLATRFANQKDKLAALEKLSGHLLSASEALEAGLITVAPDDLDWEDELRMAMEERCSLSPDALTGMEASLRFPGPENMATKVFGRLSAWQNWVFVRPNSTGENGALKLFGTGKKSRFDWERI